MLKTHTHGYNNQRTPPKPTTNQNKPNKQNKGVAHGAWDNELDLLAATRDLLSYLPSNTRSPPPRVATADPADRRCEPLERLVPNSADVRE